MPSESTEFRTRTHADADPPLVVFAGELDLAAADAAWASLESIIVPGGGLVIDMADVTFVDSRGLNVIVHALRILGDEALVLRGTPDRIVRLLDVAGLTDRVVLV